MNDKPKRRPPPARIDWLRVGHRAFTFLRTMRGDSQQVDQDHKMERGRGREMTRSLQNIARKAAGCRAPQSCDCVVCLEQREDDHATE